MVIFALFIKSAQALSMEFFVALGSASFRWVPVKRPFSVKFWHFTHNFRWNSAFFWARFGGKIGNNGWKREICILHCTLLLICYRELRICHCPPKTAICTPKNIKTVNLMFFRVASFRIPEIWAWQSMGSGVRVREVLQMQANHSPARSLPMPTHVKHQVF